MAHSKNTLHLSEPNLETLVAQAEKRKQGDQPITIASASIASTDRLPIGQSILSQPQSLSSRVKFRTFRDFQANFSLLVCLSTVDRRSRERFIESNNQIASLVEKFKLEGGAYRKYVGPPPELDNMEAHQKIPLTAYGRPGTFSVMLTLIR